MNDYVKSDVSTAYFWIFLNIVFITQQNKFEFLIKKTVYISEWPSAHGQVNTSTDKGVNWCLNKVRGLINCYFY